jgi:hypothetical protein
MPMRPIAKNRWPSFLESFSRQHAGCLCTLDVDSPAAGAATDTAGVPLEGLAFERGQGRPRVQIFVGDQLERHLGHSLSEPRGVWLEETGEGAHAGLRIEADDGAVHLRFRVPQEPEYVETYLP